MLGTVLDAPMAVELSIGLEARILRHLDEESVIGLDALVDMLPEYSWNQIFHAVDQLARIGSIALRRHRYDYTLFSTTYAA